MENVGGLILSFILLLIGLAFLMALPVMYLWDWLMPSLFGLGTITFWQALGLNIFCGILFKGSGGSTSS